MGIVNVTPDSFSDGGQYDTAAAGIAHGLRLAEAGADILDVGGESTRPGSDTVSVEDELRRVIPVIEGLRAKTDKLISIDTRKAEVMRRAAEAGADILNDVSALTHDPRSLEVAAESGLPVMLMHAQGDPKTMNENPQYSDVVLDVFDFLEQRIRACIAAESEGADRCGSGHRLRQAPASQCGGAQCHEPLPRARRARAARRQPQEADRPALQCRRSAAEGAGINRRCASFYRAGGADRAGARRGGDPAGDSRLGGRAGGVGDGSGVIFPPIAAPGGQRRRAFNGFFFKIPVKMLGLVDGMGLRQHVPWRLRARGLDLPEGLFF